MTRAGLAANYAAAFSGRLEPGKRPALLLVDMVAVYLEPGSDLYCRTAQEAVKAAALLLASARDQSRAIVHTNIAYEPGGADGGVFYRKVPALAAFERGSPVGAFPRERGRHPLAHRLPLRADPAARGAGREGAGQEALPGHRAGADAFAGL